MAYCLFAVRGGLGWPAPSTRLRAISLGAALAIALAAGPAAAEQMSFRTRPAGDDIRFAYRFETRTARPVSLAFSLPRRTVDRAKRAFGTIDKRALKREATAAAAQVLDREIAALRARYPDATIERRDGGGIDYGVNIQSRMDQAAIDRMTDQGVADLRKRYPRVAIEQRPDGGISYTGPAADNARVKRDWAGLQRRIQSAIDAASQRHRQEGTRTMAALSRELEAAIAAARRRSDAARETFLKDRSYTVDGRIRRPDYQAIARASVRDLRPLARALAAHTAGRPPREVIDLALQFFQTIPYDTLTSRLTSNGAGFAFPVAMLADNKGDCDTKSVAFAAVMRTLFPDRAIILVLLPDHALIGMDLPRRPGDRTIRHRGRHVVLMEPVGPAQLPVGQIGDQSRGRLGRIDKLLPLF